MRVPVTDISHEVQRFVVERIHSVAQLELLLVLHRDPSVEWTVPRSLPAWSASRTSGKAAPITRARGRR